MNEVTTAGATAGEFTPQDLILSRLDGLEQAMLANDPLLPGHLKAIHTQLSQQPELLHLLKPEQIGQVMLGMQRVVGIQLVAEAKKTPAKGKAAKISASDIF